MGAMGIKKGFGFEKEGIDLGMLIKERSDLTRNYLKDTLFGKDLTKGYSLYNSLIANREGDN